MPFIPQYDGPHRGTGRLTPKGSNETHVVSYDLIASSEALAYPGGGEIRRKVRLEGTIDPIPKGLEAGPHLLELENGERLECFLRVSGKVMCQPIPDQN